MPSTSNQGIDDAVNEKRGRGRPRQHRSIRMEPVRRVARDYHKLARALIGIAQADRGPGGPEASAPTNGGAYVAPVGPHEPDAGTSGPQVDRGAAKDPDGPHAGPNGKPG